MKTNLFVNLYVDKNEARQKELEFCFDKNVNNNLIDKIICLVELHDFPHWFRRFPANEKVVYMPIEGRPTFNDYFKLTQTIPADLNIIANTDIFFDQTLELTKIAQDSTNKTCLALCRWDYYQPGYYNGEDVKEPFSEFYNHTDSQDTWIFYGPVPSIIGADFTLGIAACDNKIAYLLKELGYNVVGPSKSIKTYHLHSSNIRNYLGEDNLPIYRIPPPYLLIEPTEL